jgi:hypothetical protein
MSLLNVLLCRKEGLSTCEVRVEKARLIGIGAAVTRRPLPHTTVRTGPYTAVRVGYPDTSESPEKSQWVLEKL